MAWWTRLNANYHSTKLFLLFFVTAFVWLVMPLKMELPKLTKPLGFSLLFIVLYQFVFYTYQFDYFSFLSLFKFLSLCSLTVFFYSLDLSIEKIYKNVGYVIFIVSVIILGFSLNEFYNFRIINNTTNISTYISTFGNVNMFAEFLVLTTPLLFHYSRYRDKVPQWLKLTCFSIWVFFILYSRSRSAWLGLALWTGLQLRYEISRKEQLYIGAAILAFLVCMYAPSVQDQLNSIKQHNVTARSALYEATFELIKDHPWGLKPGEYIGEIELYRMNTSVKPSEYNYYDQPHTEILKWGAQFGWLFSFVALLFITSVVFILVKWFWQKKNPFIVESFIVLTPQILFQFPYENPASIMYISLITALFFLCFDKIKPFIISSWWRVVGGAVAVLCLFNAFAFVNSVYEESTYPRSENIVSACELYPLNVKACHAKLIYYYDQRKYDEFSKHFEVEFMRNPLFIDFLRLLPVYYSVNRNNKKACEGLYVYRTLFPQQVSFDPKNYENCSMFSDYFYFDEPKKFKARYLTWLNNLK